jgi:hypothetical protein
MEGMGHEIYRTDLSYKVGYKGEREREILPFHPYIYLLLTYI